MTILVLAQNSFIGTKIHTEVGGAFRWFSKINKDGVLTGMLLALFIAVLVSYLTTLYASIGIGFAIQGQESALESMKRDLLALELKLQEKKSALAKEKQPALESMEKVTKIRYLLTKNFFASDNAFFKP